MPQHLASIQTWLFDLDNTLYPAECNLFARIDARMTAYIARLIDSDAFTAHTLQKRYFIDHGTTLSGLMAHHGVDPHHFLADVHAIEMEVLEPDPALAAAIAALPGRKLVFTNGDAPYAERVLERRGLSGVFEAVFDIHDMLYQPKPDPSAYAALCAAHAIEPQTALFAEDMARNLKPAKAIGMTTLWIDNGSEQSPDADRSFIDYTTHDLAHWLATLSTETA